MMDWPFVEEVVRHNDSRGFVFELFRQAPEYPEYVQDNISFSKRGTIRGLHYQLERPQEKYLQVIAGEILDVVMDIRVGSPRFGRTWKFNLRAGTRVRIPTGMAHGFLTRQDAYVYYKMTEYYGPTDQYGVKWPLPVQPGNIMSFKDRILLPLEQIPENLLPVYEG